MKVVKANERGGGKRLECVSEGCEEFYLQEKSEKRRSKSERSKDKVRSKEGKVCKSVRL